MTFPSEQEFRAWLDGMPDDARPCSGRQCPLDAWLPDWHEMAPSAWVWKFIEMIDSKPGPLPMDGGPWSNCTVAEIRAALDAGGG